MKSKREHYESCMECAVKLGAKVPKGGMVCTVWYGACPYCGTLATLTPHVDYDWPKLKQKAVFD